MAVVVVLVVITTAAAATAAAVPATRRIAFRCRLWTLTTEAVEKTTTMCRVKNSPPACFSTDAFMAIPYITTTTTMTRRISTTATKTTGSMKGFRIQQMVSTIRYHENTEILVSGTRQHEQQNDSRLDSSVGLYSSRFRIYPSLGPTVLSVIR